MNLEEQFSRLMQILQLVEAEPWTWDAPALEQKFAVSRSTIERDIALLRQWASIKRRRGKFGIVELRFLPTAFSPPEALALFLGGTLFQAHVGRAYSLHLTSALKKIAAMLPAKTRTEINRTKSHVHIHHLGLRNTNPQLYQDLQDAVLQHLSVSIVYRSRASEQPTKRTIDPYGLTFQFGAWYLVANCHLRGGIRTFALDRIRWVRVLKDTHYRYPADFNLDDWLARGWQLRADGTPTTVVIRFDQDVAEWIMGGAWHPTQQLAKQPDGSLLFQITVGIYEEMLPWILGFGSKAEVLEPAPLRVAVAKAAASVVNCYGAQTVTPGPELGSDQL